MNILITGCCGFIGFSLASNFLKKKTNKIFGIDSIDNYYDTKLKLDRLKILKKKNNFFFERINIKNKNKVDNFFKKYKIDVIFHFAAQAGVRYSFINPQKYLDSNIYGFFNILENAHIHKIKKTLLASSSSIYGDVKKLPVSEEINPNEKNLYAISKNFN
jgi:UDP-glucuronate 4-epimerase